MSDKSAKKFLANNPRMMGILFTMTLLLMQAGNTIAGGGSTVVGP
ncbi:DUF7503 family protein [Haladaptatus sp. CMSO5]